VPVSYAELTKTAPLLATARHATEKYNDVRTAEADGYKAIGPDVPVMGIHFVGPHGGSSVDVEQPTILLYEKDSSAVGGPTIASLAERIPLEPHEEFTPRCFNRRTTQLQVLPAHHSAA
jgi:hypothetical protein